MTCICNKINDLSKKVALIEVVGCLVGTQMIANYINLYSIVGLRRLFFLLL